MITYTVPDYLHDKAATDQLVARIEAYWAERGVRANARAKRALVKGGSIWVVRSDVFGGSVDGA